MPAVCIPIYIGLIMAKRKAVRDGKLTDIQSNSKNLPIKEKLTWFFWQMDVIGVILLTALLALILIPLTVAGGVSANWRQAHVIVMLVIGVLCIPTFVVWENKFARHPCVPFKLLNNRSILAGLFMAMLLNMTWYLQGE
jgi:SIT family siderophore-iron:H+ symporter-like MFS transporter